VSAIERLRNGLIAGGAGPFMVKSEWIAGLAGDRRSVEMIRDAVNLAPVFLALCDAIAERNVAVCWSACDDQAQNVCHCGSDAVEGCPCALANSAIGAAWLNLVSIP
jgi:hypothetical protein